MYCVLVNLVARALVSLTERVYHALVNLIERVHNALVNLIERVYYALYAKEVDRPDKILSFPHYFNIFRSKTQSV